MALDFSSLKHAISSLERAQKRSEGVPDDEELRDAVIQRFEYTYELCWKMLKRKLEEESPVPPLIDTLSFRELLREGAERGIIDEVEAWLVYRDQRNIVSHTYDAGKAQSVYKTSFEFLNHAKSLLAELEKRKS